MPSTTARHTAKRAYAAAAHGAGSLLTSVGLMGKAAPSRDRRLRHWLYSLTRVHDSVAMIDLDVPWWTYDAIGATETWLAARREAAVFEYGAGASTVWLARRSATVHSVEHDVDFAALMAGVLADVPNVELTVRPPEPEHDPRVPSAKEGYAGLDFTSYVDAIDGTDGLFDLVVIDGRAREACLAKALPRLATDGLVVFDNTRRRRYRTAIEQSGLTERRLRGLTPTLPYPDQTSLLTRPS
jgi:hypothetical protein